MIRMRDVAGEFRMNRRQMLSGVAGAAAALSTSATTSAANAASLASAPQRGGIKIADITLAVVSDGPLDQGDPVGVVQGIEPDQIRGALRDEFLNETTLTLEQNVVVIDLGNRLAIVDTGPGVGSIFGDKPGKLIDNLAAAGIAPTAVTDVLLTHGHPDHMWGLLDQHGALNFPNAQVHISEADFGFFADPAGDSDPKLGPLMGKCRATLKAVEKQLGMVRDGAEVLPGVVAMAAPGHTPGHTLYRIQSGNEALVLGGDIAHHYAIFTRFPDAGYLYDTDPAQAVETRKRIFDMLATDRVRLHAYHLPFPGIGHLARAGNAYRWVPPSLDSI